MSFHFCSITTSSHLFKTYALADSLQKFGGFLHVLKIDEDGNNDLNPPSNVKLYELNDLESEIAQKIISKYRKNKDKLRWTLKPVFLNHLFNSTDKVVYVDNDIYFFNTFDFLFHLLDKKDFLLTPHHYPRNPLENQNWFEANFKMGIYNAGFIGVNKNAKIALKWWAEACLYRCEKNYLRGLYDDQKYLDLIPVVHPNTLVLEHKGCNVAEWNRDICKRIKTEKGILINGEFPVIFYHFNPYSLQQIIVNPESDMQGFFDIYFKNLLKYKPALTKADLYREVSRLSKIKLAVWDFLNKLNNKNIQ